MKSGSTIGATVGAVLTACVLFAGTVSAQTVPSFTLDGTFVADNDQDRAPTADAGQPAPAMPAPEPDAAAPAPAPADATTGTDPGADQSGSDSHGTAGVHMFGVLPNYTTVEGAKVYAPVAAGQKFRMAALNTFDPYVYPFVAFVASMSRNYGPGGSGYLKQYAASMTDNSVGNYLTTAVLPAALHQDPRYFERGTGGFLHRAAYAASRSIVTHNDSGRAQFNLSEIGGNAIAAGVSNFYYPSADRTVTGTLTRWGMQVMWDTLSNELKEFWPDVRRKLHGG